MTVSRAATGARIAGDDFQFLVAAHAALRALHDPRGMEEFAIESKDDAPLDDIVMRFARPPHEHVQVKFSVDAASPLTSAGLREPQRNGRSLLQRIHDRWMHLRVSDSAPLIRLIAAKQIDAKDPVLSLRDSRSELLVPFALDASTKRGQEERRAWSEHLGISTDRDLDSFLQNFRISAGRTEATEREALSARMFGHGLRCDDDAVTLFVAAIRDWVKGARPVFNKNELAAAIEHIGLGRVEPATHVSFSVVSRDPASVAAHVVRDVTDIFDAATDPMQRREPVEANVWRTRITDEFASARDEVRATRAARVLVTGHMRLACWFHSGATFRQVEGFTVVSGAHHQRWSAEMGDGAAEELRAETRHIDGDGRDLAIAVSITHPISDEVFAHIGRAATPIGRLLSLSIEPTGARSIRDGAHAAGIAVAIQRHVQRVLASFDADRLHLFLGCPAGLALLIGHRWNRLRSTIVYDDRGAGRGYFPTFEVSA